MVLQCGSKSQNYPPPIPIWLSCFCLKSCLFGTCVHAQCRVHFFHHGEFYFRLRQQFLGHLHFWGCLHLPRRSCLFSLSSFWDVVFINEVIFRFEVSFNFEVIFTLRGHPHCCLISWSQKKSVNFCLNSKLCHNIPMKKKWNLYEMFTLSLAQLWPSLSDIFHAYYLGL